LSEGDAVRAENDAVQTENEARYRLLAENSTDVVFVTTPEGVLKYLSPAIRGLTGFEPGELVGRSGFDFVHPDEIEQMKQFRLELLGRAGAAVSLPYRVLRKAGDYIWIEGTARPIRDEAGTVIEIQVAARDVTARVEAERHLRESRAMLARAEGMAGFGSWEWDLRTDKVTWSDELYHIYGLDPGSFNPGQDDYFQYLAPEDHDRVRKTVLGASETGSGFRYLCTILRTDGERRIIEAHGETELDDEGNPQVMRGTAQDVTERVRAQAELAETHAELKRRTDELERSNLELEQFAYDASHDLGEPLRIMSRLARTMAERYGERLDAQGTQVLTSIVDGAERMQMLISDLLEYSRVSREALQRATVDCRAAFDEAVELLSESIAEKNGVVTCGELPVLEANPAQFRQLLQNLLSNALKFSLDSDLRVHVDAGREELGWRFSVSDNGIGIDPGNAQRVFELFRRLHPGDAYAGTGMGLSICKRIVERHGGRIWVEPAEPRGSVFLFTIPDPRSGAGAEEAAG
jgi:PAS domain S-box-containing protein